VNSLSSHIKANNLDFPTPAKHSIGTKQFSHFMKNPPKSFATLLDTGTLPSVFTLGKEPFALGKDFAERSTRQSPLGNFFHGKNTLPSAFYRGARQNI
jgi:hypothetical protein